MKFHIRALGGWTRQLHQKVLSCPRRVNNMVRMDVNVEGPYGSCSIPINDPDVYEV